MKIIALVSTYNSMEFMANRLDNLLDQTVEGLQIYVLDAASPQEERLVVQQYQQDPRAQRTPIMYERTKTRIGLYAAWNRIIRSTESTYLATANTDDIVHPEYYQRAIETLEAGPYDIVYCPWYISPTVNQKWPPSGIIDGVADPEIGTTCGHFPVWRRSLHEHRKIGLFDERFKVIGDSAFWARIKHYGARFGKVDEVMGCYATRGEGNLYWSAKDQAGNRLCQTEEWLAGSIKYD
jgi:glycosyltransferase involved in cell wall biosynthesis